MPLWLQEEWDGASWHRARPSPPTSFSQRLCSAAARCDGDAGKVTVTVDDRGRGDEGVLLLRLREWRRTVELSNQPIVNF